MAALFVKSLLFPRKMENDSAGGRYTALRPTSSDMERGESSSTNPNRPGTTTPSPPDDEKSTTPNNISPSLLQSTRINPRLISDATIGLSDGLTVPFALTAGLSALGDTHVVIYGGLAELIAGGISMGLGGYLGAKSEAEAYRAALLETKAVVAADGADGRASAMVRETFGRYGFAEGVLESVVRDLRAEPEGMVEFLMRFRHGLVETDFAPARAYGSGVTISAGYFFGGLVALLPYLFVEGVREAFVGSVVVMAIALFGFGWAKTALVGEGDRWVCCKNGVQMMVLGGVAAGAAMACVKSIG